MRPRLGRGSGPLVNLRRVCVLRPGLQLQIPPHKVDFGVWGNSGVFKLCYYCRLLTFSLFPDVVIIAISKQSLVSSWTPSITVSDKHNNEPSMMSKPLTCAKGEMVKRGKQHLLRQWGLIPANGFSIRRNGHSYCRPHGVAWHSMVAWPHGQWPVATWVSAK